MFLIYWIKSGCNKSRRKRTVKTFSCQTQMDISESGENRFNSVTTDCEKMLNSIHICTAMWGMLKAERRSGG